MIRLQNKLKTRKNILSVFFTAGYPDLDSTEKILINLENNGVDIVEIGMPFSDPVADGETIQYSSKIALENGMSLKLLFNQLKDIRNKVTIPLILMGYINPIYKYGFENFLKKCHETGIDGLIIPDLPLEIYENDYKHLFEKYGISNIFLVSPETEESRIRKIDSMTNTFIYVVSSSSITGNKSADKDKQNEYFQRIKDMKLVSPYLIGFGVNNRENFNNACQYSNGAIIGSSFIKKLSPDNIEKDIKTFVNNILF